MCSSKDNEITEICNRFNGGGSRENSLKIDVATSYSSLHVNPHEKF